MNEASKRLSAVRSMAFLPLSFLALVLMGVVAMLGIVEPEGSPGIIEGVIATLVVINLFFYLQSSKLNEAAQALIGLIGIFLVLSLYTGAADRVGPYWLILFPLLASIVVGRFVAAAMTGLFLLACLPALLLSSKWALSYSSGDLAGLMIAVVVVAIIMGMYDRALRQTTEEVADVIQDAGEAQSLKVQIAQRQNAEAKMSEALRLLEENNEKLERITAIDEATISSIGEAVLIVDHDGTIIRANPSSGRVLGLNQEEIIGNHVTDDLTFTGLETENVTVDREQIVIYQSLAHRAIKDETYKITKPDGSNIYAHMTASPLVVSGEVYGAVVVVRDVTEEVSVDRAKSEFVSIASHQLRTPLSTINWYLEMVLSGDFGEVQEEQKEYIQEAYDASKRMGDLINALLNASRLDVGVIAIEPTENVDFKEIVKGVFFDLESRIKKKQITIQRAISETIPMMALDTRIMEIILLNLLTNAVKYSPQGSIVELRADMDGEFLRIVVEDHGYGIPAASQDKIFTKMFRAENAVENEPDGNGLGLYIIKSIVETIGGDIGFVSREKDGTTFTVRIPKSGMEKRGGAKQLSLDPNLN